MEIATPPSLAQAAAPAQSAAGKFKLLVVVLIIVAIADAIGMAQFKVGPGLVVLMPMLWALLIAAAWGIAHRQLPAFARIDTGLQGLAGGLLNAALMLFLVKSSIMVGAALPIVKQAGFALVFQEFGHALGTLALGLPLALILGIKREAVGSTFSVGREGNIIIIAGKYGMDSPEGRGVLAEYITGTVLGALFLAILVGFITSLHIFDPRALAMGAGVGSGSLMAAAVGAISAQVDPEMVKQVVAIAAASNLISTVGGFYFAIFLSLPVCAWLYGKLEPILGRITKRGRQPVTSESTGNNMSQAFAVHSLSLADTVLGWVVMIGGVAIANHLSYKVSALVSVEGLLAIALIVAVVEAAKRLIPRMPMVLVRSIVALVLGIPHLLPFSDALLALTDKLNFMAFTTPVLALAGFSVAKDLPLFRRLGWRIVVVSLAATAGTFIFATLIAEFFHR
jgi:hypothetical protein